MGRRGRRQTTKRASTRSQRVQGRPSRGGKAKVCFFCGSRVEWVDYKDVNTLRRLMSDRGKIKARRVTGTCRQHQRDVAIAIKTAREMALLPYALSPSAADKTRRGGAPRDSRPSGYGPPESTPDGDEISADGPPDAEGNGDIALDDQVSSDSPLATDDASPDSTRADR